MSRNDVKVDAPCGLNLCNGKMCPVIALMHVFCEISNQVTTYFPQTICELNGVAWKYEKTIDCKIGPYPNILFQNKILAGPPTLSHDSGVRHCESQGPILGECMRRRCLGTQPVAGWSGVGGEPSGLAGHPTRPWPPADAPGRPGPFRGPIGRGRAGPGPAAALSGAPLPPLRPAAPSARTKEGTGAP